MMEDNFLKVAKQAAIQAGKITLKYFGTEHELKVKGADNSNFATLADLETEKKIIETISKHFPEHSFIAEESGVQEGSEYTWVIDPIDGTTVFASGLPYFTVSIGLLKDKTPILGVIYQPITGDLYHGILSQGAFLNDKQIQVSKTAKLEKAILGIDFAHMGKRAQKTEKYILPFLNKISYPISTGGDVLLFAQVGSGVIDGFPTETNIWDCITGAVIVKEAGGKVTDGAGNGIDWSKKRMEIVMSNGLIHDEILKSLSISNS